MPFLPLDSPARAGGLQLVATLGPASFGRAADLAAAGATSFRVNASHFDLDELSAAISSIKRCCPGAPVIVDLQGAKMRIALPAPRDVASGDVVTFSPGPEADVCVPHPELFIQARVGDTLSVDDGRVRFEVVGIGPQVMTARAVEGGRLLPNKGLNVEQHPVRLERLTDRDASACRLAARASVPALAFSFMIDGTEAGWLRAVAPASVVIGKIERAEAVTRLGTIATRVDAIWICRGDLAAQLGADALARCVAAVEPSRLPVPVLMAGQVLEHLTSHPEPTRSEVCHLFDLVARGYAGIVLSDETAIGRDPVHAVSTAAGLLAAFRH
jgi:pyruvate kinase